MYDNAYGTGTPVARHNIKTGNQVPSDILAEIDRKIDDGNPVGGIFQFSPYNGGGGRHRADGRRSRPVLHRHGLVRRAPVTNCGGTSLL